MTILGFAEKAPGGRRAALALIAFLVCLIATPLYLGRMALPAQPHRKHQAVSTLAFVVWAYSVGGAAGLFGPKVLNIYDSAIASFALVIFTLVSGIPTP